MYTNTLEDMETADPFVHFLGPGTQHKNNNINNNTQHNNNTQKENVHPLYLSSFSSPLPLNAFHSFPT
jgi:hypothetical protein